MGTLIPTGGSPTKVSDVVKVAPLAKRKGTSTGRQSNVTPTADPDLKVTLAAATWYMLNGFVVYNGLAAADLKGGLYGPTNSFANGIYQALGASASTSEGSVTMGAVGFGNGFVFGCIGTGSDLIAKFDLYIYSGDGGDCGFTWAQSVTNATATTVKADSTFMFTPMNPT